MPKFRCALIILALSHKGTCSASTVLPTWKTQRGGVKEWRSRGDCFSDLNHSGRQASVSIFTGVSGSAQPTCGVVSTRGLCQGPKLTRRTGVSAMVRWKDLHASRRVGRECDRRSQRIPHRENILVTHAATLISTWDG